MSLICAGLGEVQQRQALNMSSALWHGRYVPCRFKSVPPGSSCSTDGFQQNDYKKIKKKSNKKSILQKKNASSFPGLFKRWFLV